MKATPKMRADKAVGPIPRQSGGGANVASMIEPSCEVKEYIRDPAKHQGATARLQSLHFKSTRSAQEEGKVRIEQSLSPIPSS